MAEGEIGRKVQCHWQNFSNLKETAFLAQATIRHTEEGKDVTETGEDAWGWVRRMFKEHKSSRPDEGWVLMVCDESCEEFVRQPEGDNKMADVPMNVLEKFARECFGNFFTRGKFAQEVMPVAEIDGAINCIKMAWERERGWECVQGREQGRIELPLADGYEEG